MKSFYILLLALLFCISTLQSQSAWTTVATTTDDLQTICFIDSLTGWVGGSIGTQGVIRKTTDGGITWTNQEIPVTNTITKIIFLDSLVGFASGAKGTILKTTDRGHTWFAKSTGSVDNLTSVFFLNSQLGWASGWTTALFTKDGGETWSSRPTPGAITNFDIAFKDSLEGMVVGADNHCYKTTDGGNTWQWMISAPVGPVSYFAVYYLSPMRVLVAGGSNIGQSNDGGLTWWSRLVGYDGQVNGISFGNSTTGWAASAIRIFKSIDGGTSWIPQSIPISSGYLRAIHTPDGIHAWALGEKKILANRPGMVSAAQSTISANPVSIRADGKSTCAITVRIKDSEGTNFTSSAGIVELNTTAGTLGKVYDMFNGTYTAILTSSHTVESAVITGKLNGDSIGSVIKVEILSAAPALSLSTISVSPAKLFTDSQGAATVTVQVKYLDGVNFTSSAGVIALKTTVGSLSPVTDHNDGSYSAVFTTPPTSGVATITATLDGNPLTGSATIQLIKSGPNLVLSTISVALISVSADHVAKDSIRVQIKDTVGNNYRASAGTLILRTTAGTLGTVADNHDGSYTAVLTLSADESQAVVTAELDGALLATSCTVMNDWRTFPMEIGDTWYYKYYSNPLFGTTPQKTGHVVRKVTAISETGQRTVSVNTEYTDGSKGSSETEYWMYQNGKFTLNNPNYTLYDPIYIATVKNDSIVRWIAGTYSWTLLTKEVLGKTYHCQYYIYGTYWSGSGYSRRRMMAEGLGLIYLSNSNSFASTGTIDSTVLIGARINGVLIGNLIASPDVSTPPTYTLSQNYPNPFNPSTTISFSLPSRSSVTLKIFDVMGREVSTIVSEEMPAGSYSRQWNATGFPSGVYFYRLQAGAYAETKRLLLLR